MSLSPLGFQFNLISPRISTPLGQTFVSLKPLSSLGQNRKTLGSSLPPLEEESDNILPARKGVYAWFDAPNIRFDDIENDVASPKLRGRLLESTTEDLGTNEPEVPHLQSRLSEEGGEDNNSPVTEALNPQKPLGWSQSLGQNEGLLTTTFLPEIVEQSQADFQDAKSTNLPVVQPRLIPNNLISPQRESSIDISSVQPPRETPEVMRREEISQEEEVDSHTNLLPQQEPSEILHQKEASDEADTTSYANLVPQQETPEVMRREELSQEDGTTSHTNLLPQQEPSEILHQKEATENADTTSQTNLVPRQEFPEVMHQEESSQKEDDTATPVVKPQTNQDYSPPLKPLGLPEPLVQPAELTPSSLTENFTQRSPNNFPDTQEDKSPTNLVQKSPEVSPTEPSPTLETPPSWSSLEELLNPTTIVQPKEIPESWSNLEELLGESEPSSVPPSSQQTEFTLQSPLAKPSPDTQDSQQYSLVSPLVDSNSSEGQEGEIAVEEEELEILARKIYSLLKMRLEVENEQQNHFGGGGIPWIDSISTLSSSENERSHRQLQTETGVAVSLVDDHLEILSREVYRLLRRRLELDQERQGNYYFGNLS